MDRFKHVLLAASPGRLDVPAMRSAVAFAAANEATVTVLDVVEPLASWRRSVNVEGRMIDLQELMLRDRTERLGRFVDRARGPTEPKVYVKTGKPAVEVIRHVLRHGCDLVIVGEPAPSRERAPGVSSGVMQLLRKCPVPVWAMRPAQATTLRVMALVDPDPSDSIRNGLNDLVLELATSMVIRTDGELHVAHAWSLVGDLPINEYMPYSGELMGRMATTLGDEHRTLLEMLTARHGVEEKGSQIHLVEGDPGGVLPALAKQLDITLIVMGTVARTGLAGFIMGNTAETLLRSVECSVLAVKPDGFVSPVHLPDQPPDEALSS